MSIQENLLRPIICVQVNLFVETMFVQVNLFVETMFVKVNPLLISFRVNLFSLTIPIMLTLINIRSTAIFWFFLSILIFSVYHKFSIITMNIFTNLLLTIVILLSKLTCWREFFIIFISRNSTFLRFSFTFRSCQTMLLLALSEPSFLINSMCFCYISHHCSKFFNI